MGLAAQLTARQWDLSCMDWESRIIGGRSLVPVLPLFDAPAAKAVAIFNRLRLADVPGTPTMADAGGDWFRDIVRALFGSMDPVTRERAIREIMLLVPKKNSKTSNGALLMLTALLMNARPAAPFLLVAPTHDIAEIAFAQMAGAISLDPKLREMLHVQNHLKVVTDRRNQSRLEVLSFDPKVLTGQKPAGVLVDELHVMSSMSRAQSALGQLRSGMISTPEAFMVFITTQSEKPPAGVFRSELQKARAIRDGTATGHMLPVLYELPAAMARAATVPGEPAPWEDEALWAAVNPNAGRSITVRRLAEDYAVAKESGEEERRRWASQHLNIEVGIGLMSNRWAGADYWQTAADAMTLDELLARSEVVVAGVDGGGLDDLLALGLMGREKVTRRWLFWCHAWAAPAVLERRKSEAARLQDFADGGDLTIVAGLPDDVSGAADIIADVEARGLLAMVGLDPFGVGGIIDALAERDIEGAGRVVGISQGWQLSGAIKTAERKLSDGTLIHCGQPLVAWAVGNAKIEPKGNALTITKQVAGAGKIDPVMALLNCVALMSKNPDTMSRTITQGYVLL